MRKRWRIGWRRKRTVPLDDGATWSNGVLADDGGGLDSP